jgi:hypothetical protein
MMVALKEGFSMRILFATDGSRSADRARDLVTSIPWPEGSVLRVVSVASPSRPDILATTLGRERLVTDEGESTDPGSATSR